ncbi:peptidylprolyl isomerase [Candidatus Dojkabacteria bacterium]|nr:peptidylprolyl isomerase [Candidatus Dojkabacteria bacterium]
MILSYFVVAGYQFPFAGFLIDQETNAYEYDKAPAMQLVSGKDYRAKIYTNKGLIELDLYEQNAPVTVNNFVFLANAGYYDGVKFHRVVNDFLIQSGSRTTLDRDPDNDGLGGPGYTFDDEINWSSLSLNSTQIANLQSAGYSNDISVTSRRLEKYAVAMANAGPDTNGSQFFIVTAANTDSRLDPLQGRHTVFATVVGGQSVVETINSAQIENAADDSISKPIGDYYIERVEIYSL